MENEMVCGSTREKRKNPYLFWWAPRRKENNLLWVFQRFPPLGIRDSCQTKRKGEKEKWAQKVQSVRRGGLWDQKKRSATGKMGWWDKEWGNPGMD